jgi:biopolymer transport protein ExbB/TolQ
LDILPEVSLPWSRQDIEQRFGFPGGRYTQVNTWFTALLALAATIIFYLCLMPFSDHYVAKSFNRPDSVIVTYPTVFFSFWALMILLIKSRKLAYQKKALKYQIVPKDHDFVLSSGTVDTVMQNIFNTVDDPKHFVLFNRIVIALSNLRNLGQITDVDDILRSQAENDESYMETSYMLLGGFIWAIPVLGFIGTVIGLSIAIGDFGSVLQSADDLSQIKDSLQGVTSGLATAFETTMHSLVAALFIQLILTYLKKSEEEFLDACSEYCLRNIVNRLRIMPFETVE